MSQAKEKFLRHTLAALLQKLPADRPGAWGKMNAQQMVEHFADAVKVAYGKIPLPALYSGEELQKMYDFMMSDKPFQENIRNPFMQEAPPPARKATMDESIAVLQKELEAFFHHYAEHPDAREQSPFFGKLNYAEQLQLLSKHAIHHLKQFGIEHPMPA